MLTDDIINKSDRGDAAQMIKEQFNVEYKIGQKEKDAIKKIKKISQFNQDVSPDGWIKITIGDYEYGFLQNDSLIDGFELLDVWFCTFKDVYTKLISDSEIVFDYWDAPDEFFIFKRQGNLVTVQYYEREFPVENGRIQRPNVYAIKLVAETTIVENLFFNKIKETVNEFWNEVGSLNPILKDYVEKFKI